MERKGRYSGGQWAATGVTALGGSLGVQPHQLGRGEIQRIGNLVEKSDLFIADPAIRIDHVGQCLGNAKAVVGAQFLGGRRQVFLQRGLFVDR